MLNEINSRLDTAESKTTETEDITIETTPKWNNKKDWKKWIVRYWVTEQFQEA